MQKLEENKENVTEKGNNSSWDGSEKNNKNTEGMACVPTWDDVFNFMARSKKTTQEETLASEIIRTLGEKEEKNGKTVTKLLVFTGAIITMLLFVDYSLAQTNERNNQKFLEYLSQYDFVSQDGEGFNYYNSDVGGDVNNGTTGTEEEEP